MYADPVNTKFYFYLFSDQKTPHIALKGQIFYHEAKDRN